MFDLEKEISNWRRQMRAAGIKAPVPLDELENHLRDDVEQQIRAGAEAQPAFAAAVLHVGGAGALKCEFTKVGEPIQVLKGKLLWVVVGLGFLGCWFAFGQSPALALVSGFLLAGLIIASFIDFKHFVIPDTITIGGIFVGLLCSLLLPQLQGQQHLFAGMGQSLLGIGVGAGLLYFVSRAGNLAFGRQPIRLTPTSLQISEDRFSSDAVVGLETTGTGIVLPRQAIGMGTVKFMAAIGAFLGWQAVVFSLIASSLLGACVNLSLVAGRRGAWAARLPYGPYLALAAVIWMFAGKQIIAALFAP